MWAELLTRKGPCSVSSPSRELQPGPPFSHSTTGSEDGLFWDSTNLKQPQVEPQVITGGHKTWPRPAR